VAKPVMPPTASDAEVRALLERYRCPTPFHAVRTRFLGSIASPDLQVAPMKTVEALMGFWYRLTRHQERSAPFRLTRIEVPATREGMATLALMRREELDGFTEGLFGDNESMDLPERAHHAIKLLGEMRAMLEGVRELAENPSKPAEPGDFAALLGHFRELTQVAEHEMHEAVLSCARARRQMLRTAPAGRPVVH